MKSTTERLIRVSSINNLVVVGGLFDYMGKSNNICVNLFTVSLASPTGYALNFFRLNQSEIYCVSYTPSQSLLYFSTDDGTNWTQKLDTVGDLTRYIAFYDSLSGIRSWQDNLIATTDGGDTWNFVSTPIVWPAAVSAIGVYAVALYALEVRAARFIYQRTEDTRGHILGVILEHTVKDFWFLNQDTILLR